MHEKYQSAHVTAQQEIQGLFWLDLLKTKPNKI